MYISYPELVLRSN